MPDNRIEIETVMLDKLSGTVEKMDAKLDDFREDSKRANEQFAASTKTAGVSITDFRSAYMIAMDAVRVGQQIIEATAGATVEYANQVRQLSTVSGESTENTSRFIQVLDDYKIGADDALIATKALTKQGLTPSIETLAQLSDEYLSINDAQERNEFVLKNLGKAGLQWVEVLGKGSAAIKSQGAAVSQSLILSQKAVDDARKYEIALDNWNDAVMGLKVSIGSALLPVLTDLMNSVSDNARANEIMLESEKQLSVFQKAFTDQGEEAWQTALEQARAEREAATATMMHSEAVDDGTSSQEDYAEALKKTSAANNELLGLVGTMQREQTSYGEKVAEVTNDVNLSDDERKAKLGELAAEHDRVTKQIVLDLMTQKFTADGILTDDEMNWLLEKGEAWGLYSADVVADAKTAIDWADKISQSISAIPAEKTITINQVFNPITNAGKLGGRASGGPVSADTPYMVGERGPELFVPQTSGSIVPNDKMNDPTILAAALALAMPSARDIGRETARALQRAGLGVNAR